MCGKLKKKKGEENLGNENEEQEEEEFTKLNQNTEERLNRSVGK